MKRSVFLLRIGERREVVHGILSIIPHIHRSALIRCGKDRYLCKIEEEANRFARIHGELHVGFPKELPCAVLMPALNGIEQVVPATVPIEYAADFPRTDGGAKANC